MISEFLGAILCKLQVIPRDIDDVLVRVSELLVDAVSLFRIAQGIFSADDKGDWNAVVNLTKVNWLRVSLTHPVILDRNHFCELVLDIVLTDVL